MSRLADAIALASGCKPEFREMVFARHMGLAVVGKDTSTVSQGVPAFWFARALEPGQMASMWRPFAESVWVQRAIRIIAGPISAVSPDFYPRSPVVTGRRNKRYRSPKSVFRNSDAAVDSPQLESFLSAPARGLGYSDFIEATVGWLKMEEAFWILSDNTLAVPYPKLRAPDPIIIAQPYRMRHYVDNGELVGWTYNDPSGKQWKLLPEQVIQIKGWNPYDPWRGLGEYESAQIASEADWLAGKFGRNLMANNGDTGPFIVAKSGLPADDQRDQIIAALREKRHAQLRGEFKPMFVTGDIEVQDPKISSVDAPFISQRIENRHEIAAAFGIPMSMFDIKAAYSMGADSDIFWLINFTCIPTGAKICGALSTLAQRLFGLDLEILLDWEQHPVLQAARRSRLKDADGLWAKGMPMRSISDYLDLGIPDYEGDDVGYLPINVSPATGEEAEAANAPITSDDYSEVNPDQADNPDAPEPVKEMLRILRAGPRQPSEVRKPENKARWEAHMRRRSGYVKLIQSKTSKVFLEFRAKALKHLHAAWQKDVVNKSLLDIIFDPEAFNRDLQNSLNNPMNAVLGGSVADLMAEIGRTENPWTMPPKVSQAFIERRQAKLASVSDTARSQLQTVIEGADK
ncbi:MAG TPA: phage portal protein, partial [Verrucomicrobiae bacterium]